MESTIPPEQDKGPNDFQIPFSNSVGKAYRSIPRDKQITSLDILRALFTVHKKFGDVVGSELFAHDLPKLTHQNLLTHWFEDVISLFDLEQVTELHGKLLILGLAELDKELKLFLSDHGIIRSLREDLKEDFDDLLISPPDSLTDQKEDESIAPEKYIKDNPTILHSDGAAEEDKLGRDPLVKALAIWLTRNWNEINKDKKSDHSFIMHLHGAWGSGKTSLLKLLKVNLKEGKGFTEKDNKVYEKYQYEWNCVWFNAWQHQHIEPSWWPLMDKIYRNSVRGILLKNPFKSIYLFLSEQLWRLSTGNRSNFILLLFTLSIVLLVSAILVEPSEIDLGDFKLLQETLKPVTATLGIIGTLWSGSSMILRSLFWGSTKNADEFLQFTTDPMEKIRKHFTNQMKRLESPLIVFVDDLDRCRAEYVVSLMEGIQTMLNNKQLVFIVAADRRWLNNCFELVYDNFSGRITEPGRRMGYLFLEKAFQLSISMPRMTPTVKEQFIDHLYNRKKPDNNSEQEKVTEKARKALENKHGDADIIGTLSGNLSNDIPGYIRQAWQNEAVKQSASREVEEQTEVFLKGFSHLLEPNPRALKRLINAYSILRGWALYTDYTILINEVKRSQFALWTILKLRWPILAEYLEEDPAKLNDLKAGNFGEEIPESILAIAQKQDVLDVIEGREIRAMDEGQEIEIELTVEAIREITGIKNSISANYE